jgi:carbon-monoxide dehydrogenase large subunit
MELQYVGKRVPRLDGLEKVTGRAIYSVDVDLPGLLHGAILRSTKPHARILDIDVSEARSMSGVRVVVTGKDVPYTHGMMIRDQPFLAIDRVRYVGEPVVAVAAETQASAQSALSCIRVRYEDLPAVFDPRDAIAPGAPILHEHLAEYPRLPAYQIIPGTNICVIRTFSRGDVQAGFAEADEVLEDEFYSHAVSHTPMEVHAAVAQYSPATGEYVVWSATDAPHRRMKEIAEAMSIPMNKVRFLTVYSGGGFGTKGSPVAEVLAVALARFAGGRPVKVVFSREEELSSAQTRHAAYLKLKTGVKRDGTLTARSADLLWDKGAYASKGPDVAYRGALTIFGPYRIPNLQLQTRLVYTNKQIAGAYRGYGTSQVAFACESQMDIIARRLKMDPLEIRLKNGYVEGDRFINGQSLVNVGLKECLERAAREIGWGTPKPAPSGPKKVGRGIAAIIKGTATPSVSQVLILVNQDGSITVSTGAVEIGAGEKTVLAQIAADAIGADLDSISVPNCDTRSTPFDYGTTSSRVTFHNGNAVRFAGEKVRQKILEIAGEILQTDPARLRLSRGKIFEDGVEKSSLKEVVSRKFQRGGMIIQESSYTTADSALLKAEPPNEGMSAIFWVFAAQAVEVEVDTETGVVKARKVAAAHDVGRAINPMLCEQQIEGGVVMGLSNALLEEFKMENGRVLNNTLADYKIATCMDLPEIVPMIVETNHPEGPMGAKGIGEPAGSPVAPAVANAVFDAIGVRIKDLPITPEKIVAALGRAVTPDQTG